MHVLVLQGLSVDHQMFCLQRELLTNVKERLECRSKGKTDASARIPQGLQSCCFHGSKKVLPLKASGYCLPNFPLIILKQHIVNLALCVQKLGNCLWVEKESVCEQTKSKNLILLKTASRSFFIEAKSTVCFLKSCCVVSYRPLDKALKLRSISLVFSNLCNLKTENRW